MNLKELSDYITSLLRSEPEVIASFLMGVLLTAVLAFSIRRWTSSGFEASMELARKDSEMARKDTELARKDVQIASVEARLAIVEGRLMEEKSLVTTLRNQGLVPQAFPPADSQLLERFAALEAICAQLKSENQDLRQINQSIEVDSANLRTKLAQAVDEANHWAKWARVHEENAHFTETGSLREV